MKVIVLWENSGEESLAQNLVAVLRKIGAMLVYGRVQDDGVRIEDWASRPRVNLDCMAAPKPGILEPGTYTYPALYEMPYGSPGFDLQPIQPMTSREYTREMVRMFPDEGTTAKRKPVVPKPDTTETGVTVRDLDMWEEDDDHHE